MEEDMNIDNGEIYKFDSNESLEAAKEKEKLVELNEQVAKKLLMLEPVERPKVYRDLVSKNHAAKRRARRKIAKASRRRNR